MYAMAHYLFHGECQGECLMTYILECLPGDKLARLETVLGFHVPS